MILVNIRDKGDTSNKISEVRRMTGVKKVRKVTKKNLDLLTPIYGNLKLKMAAKWPQDGPKMASR